MIEGDIERETVDESEREKNQSIIDRQIDYNNNNNKTNNNNKMNHQIYKEITIK